MDTASVSSSPEVSRQEYQELAAEVRDLSQRIALLERATVTAQTPVPPTLPKLELSSDLVPAIGKALLAIAGAYLLRAFTELQILPLTAGVIAGILYAGAWLWRAGRSEKKISARLYAIASFLILGPLLWEAIARLHAIPPWSAALIIALFAVASAWRPRIAAISPAACALIAITFLIGLRDLAPFTLSLLAIAACAELAGVASRWIAALLADTAVVIFTFLIARGLPEGYAPASLNEALAAQALLLLIYPAALVARRRAFTIFEIVQAACAFLIAAGGAFYLTRAAAIAILLIAGGIGCYALAFFRRAPARNAGTFAAFSIALLLTGTYLAASGILLVAIWSALATILAFSDFTGTRSAVYLSPVYLSPVYLWSSTLASGVALQSKMQIWDGAGTPPTPEALVIFVSALATYFALSRANRTWPALAAAAAWILVAASLASRFASGALVLTIFSLVLAWTGMRLGRRELVWLTYPLMGISAAKILLHDFASGNIPLVGSLLAYGVALILLPRILRSRTSENPRP